MPEQAKACLSICPDNIYYIYMQCACIMYFKYFRNFVSWLPIVASLSIGLDLPGPAN
jgi:hypothetical protein